GAAMGSGSDPGTAVVQVSCGRAVGNGTACATSTCTSDAQCASNASCVSGQCQTKGKPGVWLVAGSGGCASGGAGNVAPLLAMVLVGLWRALRRRTLERRALA